MCMHFVLRPEPPFDFEKSVQMHSRFKNSLPDLYEDGVYMRVLHVGRKPILISITSKGTVGKPRLLVDTYPPLSDKPKIGSLRKTLWSMFEPTFDFDHFYLIAKRDAIMRVIARKLRGLRPVRPPTIFESVIIAITEQQISLHAAMAIRSRLVENYGDTVARDARIFYAFPTPESLAKARSTGLRKVGLSAAKARYIAEFSRKIASDEFNLDRLTQMDDSQAVAELTKFRGIGKWTAEYVLVRGMGRVNSLPADDLGIQRAASQAYFKSRKVSAEDVRDTLTKKFAPYTGIASFYLMYYLFWKESSQ
jgi:DNA-3-methyladenine glycosylase II